MEAKYKSDAGKGWLPRPKFISEEEWDLRYTLAVGIITREEFDKAIKGLKEIKDE